MGKVERFEDLAVWTKARELVGRVYLLTRHSSFRRDIALAEQMRRAVVSILANIAEGFERRSRAEFARFLLIAAGSAGELRSQLYVVEDCVDGVKDQAATMRPAVEEISRMISGLRKTVTSRMGATGK